MFVIIPSLSFYLIFLIFYKRLNRSDSLPCWRNAFLSASVVWAVILIAITEFLSALSLIIFNWILFSWGLVCLVSALIYFKLSRRRKPIEKTVAIKLSHFERLSLFFIGIIVITVGLIALIAPPTTQDSMTYHMSRVFHWIQNHNVNHYPTHTLRQLTCTPGAEFVIMHFQILSEGDRFANLIQWFSMLGSIIGISLIAKELGAGIRSQVFSALLCTTIPMGILQGSSTQNDYVVSFWLVCFVYFFLLILKEGISLPLLLKLGASLGLALLTKGTAYLYVFPFLVWFVLSGFKRLRWNLWKPVLIIAIIAFSINFGYYIRNFDLYGRFPVLPIPIIYIKGIISLPLFISNIVRNIGLHLGTPLVLLNDAMYGVIKLIHIILGIAINDPRTTAHGDFFIPFSFNEALAGNFVHLLLIVIAMSIFFIVSRRKQKDMIFYMAALISAFFIFCFFIKWTPWNSRYHLPLFVLFCPFIAIMLSGTNNRYKVTNLVSFILILTSLPWVLHNESGKQLIGAENIFAVGRIDKYFSSKPSFRNPYVGAIDYIKSKGYSDIGIIMCDDDPSGRNWEYPLVILLQKNNIRAPRIEHINVNNISSVKYNIYPFNKFNPYAIISLKSGESDKIIYKDTIYVKEWSSEPVSVFIRR